MVYKKAQGLPVNIVVMMIIGIIIFALGVGLFAKFYNSGNQQVSNLNSQIKTGISKLECGQNTAICSPSYQINNGANQVFNLYISNLGNSKSTFKVEIGNTSSDLTKSCGSISIIYPAGISVDMGSGESAEFPFQVIANHVAQAPCNFVTVAKLIDTNTGNAVGKTPIIIRVQ